MSQSPSSSPTAHADQIHQLAQNAGFALVQIGPIQTAQRPDYIRQWLAQGSHGQMNYLAENLPLRLNPQQLLPDAKTIICVADVYPAHSLPSTKKQHPPRGRIARYAWGKDYHITIKKRLHQLADQLKQHWPQHQYRSAVDTAPILEREQAAGAGVGWVGKNTMLIHPRLGSWTLLGEILTTLEVMTQPNTSHPITTDHCGTCTRCLDACPTQCLQPYQMNAQACISYLTIEHRGLIPKPMHTHLGDWLAGCDVCQEVCPFNQPHRLQRLQYSGETHPLSSIPALYQPGPAAEGFDLLEILNWDEQARSKALQNSALKRIKLPQFKRNALILAGNYLAKHPSTSHPLYQRVLALAADPSEGQLVNQTARQVLEQLA